MHACYPKYLRQEDQEFKTILGYIEIKILWLKEFPSRPFGLNNLV
jgi:hypothetical protein